MGAFLCDERGGKGLRDGLENDEDGKGRENDEGEGVGAEEGEDEGGESGGEMLDEQT